MTADLLRQRTGLLRIGRHALPQTLQLSAQPPDFAEAGSRVGHALR